MYTYGRHFNRLGEVGQGDTIVLEDKTNRYTYLVEENVAILPKDLPAAMTVSTSEARLLLVTCTPVRVASHRMLVKAYLIKTEKLG
jgi:sortase A